MASVPALPSAGQPCTLLCHLQETINDEEKRNRKRTPKEWVIVIAIRALTNAFVLLTLFAGGVAIFFAVQFSSSQQFMLVSTRVL